MHLSTIQIDEEESTTRWFPDLEESYLYLGLCLGGEAGEVGNGIKKYARGDWTELQLIEYLEDELPDILIYLVMLASYAGVDLEKAYEKKKEYNEHRYRPAAGAE